MIIKITLLVIIYKQKYYSVYPLLFNNVKYFWFFLITKRFKNLHNISFLLV